METNAAKRVNKIYKVLLILLIVSMSFTGCMLTNTSEGLEHGFKFFGIGGESCESNPFCCGYKTDRTEFDIDDVKIDLYYGCYYGDFVESILENAMNIPSFDIYAATWDEENREYDNKYLIRHVEENFVSEKYNCEIVCRKFLIWQTTEIIYNHYETIKIPKEAFVNGNGEISILIYGTDIHGGYPTEKLITGTTLYYSLVDGKATLSNQEFKNKWKLNYES